MSINNKIIPDSSLLASTVLFVDDEQKVLKYFIKTLHNEFTIETANSVDTAIEILEQQHQEIAVVISDQRMPVKHGLELLRYTKKNHPQIIRMLTTAHYDIANSIDAINQAEVFRYIAKPWDIGELSKNLKQALNRYQSVSNHQQTPADAYRVLQEFREDCQQWLMYALHAYGDIEVYKGGIEAFACKYYTRIHKDFEKDKIKKLSASMNNILDKHFLNDEVLLDMQNQSDNGFGLSDLFSSKKH